jgi:mercuric ion transport protein
VTTCVELVYDRDCPNVDAARAALRCAFAQIGVAPAWVEWNRSARDSPDYVQGYGSPTILVNGKDVAGAEPDASADCCRLYTSDESGLCGVPPMAQIVAAMRKNNLKHRVMQKEAKL